MNSGELSSAQKTSSSAARLSGDDCTVVIVSIRSRSVGFRQ
jgi:hypothetical protein